MMPSHAELRRAGPPRALTALAGLCLALAVPSPALPQAACAQPAPVCAARAAVFVISAFDPFASAVRIGPGTLVTNRHAVADEASVKVTLKSGETVEAKTIPSAYEGDLILLHSDALGDGPALSGNGDVSGDLYTLGGDVARRSVRAYPPGRVILPPAADAPFSRLHHSAYSQPGNSGGALVDAAGHLVAIVASGGEGRFEAIPAAEIARLKAMSGPQFAARHGEISKSLRGCVEKIERAPAPPGKLDDGTGGEIVSLCLASANRQLFDLAAQTLGRGRQVERSLEMSRAAVRRDPNSINSRLTLVTTLHIAGLYEEELPHIRFLLKNAPKDTGVHRYAIQAGKWGGDMDLARKALALLKTYNPGQAETAQRFLDADIPPPERR